MCTNRFYICRNCKNIVGLINDSGVPIDCCGEKMDHMVASEDYNEKHTPKVTKENGRLVVNVGSVEHPMADDHSIKWVYLETRDGGHRKSLEINTKPIVKFTLGDDEIPVAVFSYCDKHGLYKTEI